VGVATDVLKALKEVISLTESVRKVNSDLDKIGPVLLDHEKRLVRIETKFEVYEKIAKRSLPQKS